jgi:hypothetical protein
MAVDRKPAHPDFTGLEEIMGGAVAAPGAASAVAFREWVAGWQKDRVQVLKQARFAREERALDRARTEAAAAAERRRRDDATERAQFLTGGDWNDPGIEEDAGGDAGVSPSREGGGEGRGRGARGGTGSGSASAERRSDGSSSSSSSSSPPTAVDAGGSGGTDRRDGAATPGALDADPASLAITEAVDFADLLDSVDDRDAGSDDALWRFMGKKRSGAGDVRRPSKQRIDAFFVFLCGLVHARNAPWGRRRRQRPCGERSGGTWAPQRPRSW